MTETIEENKNMEMLKDIVDRRKDESLKTLKDLEYCEREGCVMCNAAPHQTARTYLLRLEAQKWVDLFKRCFAYCVDCSTDKELIDDSDERRWWAWHGRHKVITNENWREWFFNLNSEEKP